MDSGNNIKSKLISISLIVFNLILYTAIFICLSFLFTIVHTEAQSFQTNNYQLLIQDSINTMRDFGVKQSVYTWAGSYTAKMVEWSPWNTTTNSGYGLIATNYSISFDFSLYQVLNLTPQNLPGMDTFKILVVVSSPYQSVVATCDGTETLMSDAEGTTTMNNVNVKYYHYNYSCDSLNVNRTFDRVWIVAQNTNGYSPFVALAVSNMYFIDTNDTSSESQQIIQNANANANRIIQNQNENTNKIVEEQEKTTQELEDLNDLLSDDTISDQTGIFSDINFNSTGAISGIITAPLSAIQSITSSTCSDLVVPLPYVDEDLTLPCMTAIYTEHFGAFFSIYQTIILGITAYWVFVSIFKMVQGFSDPMEDRIEVLDL